MLRLKSCEYAMRTFAGALILTITACASHVSIREKRALIDVPDVRNVIALEEELHSREGKALPAGTQWFEVLSGSQPVIVTAPHATRPFRDGQYRFSDGGGTAALALALHNVCGVTALYTTYDSPSDPNAYDNNEFKTTLGQLIDSKRPKLVLDIHASDSYRPYEVDLGTMYHASLLGRRDILTQLVKALKNEGITNISHNWFAVYGVKRSSNIRPIEKYLRSNLN